MKMSSPTMSRKASKDHYRSQIFTFIAIDRKSRAHRRSYQRVRHVCIKIQFNNHAWINVWFTKLLYATAYPAHAHTNFNHLIDNKTINKSWKDLTVLKKKSTHYLNSHFKSHTLAASKTSSFSIGTWSRCQTVYFPIPSTITTLFKPLTICLSVSQVGARARVWHIVAQAVHAYTQAYSSGCISWINFRSFRTVWSVSVNVAIIVIVVYTPSTGSLSFRLCVHSNCCNSGSIFYLTLYIQSIRSIFSPFHCVPSTLRLSSVRGVWSVQNRFIESTRCTIASTSTTYSELTICSMFTSVVMQSEWEFRWKNSISWHTLMLWVQCAYLCTATVRLFFSVRVWYKSHVFACLFISFLFFQLISDINAVIFFVHVFLCVWD